MKLNGKTCIVTGSAQGLGKEFSRRLLTAGGRVIISDLNEKVGSSTLKDFRTEFGKDKVHFVRCDVTKDEDLDNLIQTSQTVFGAPVDIFVNNAGINTDRGWRMCMEVNIIAVMSATEKAMAVMRNREGCKIINIGSVAGLVPGVGERGASYWVSKHGVVTLSRSIAGSKKEHGVDILCLCPAWADTDIITSALQSGGKAEKMIKTMGIIKVERVGEAFAKLLDSKNGTVMAIMHGTPCFEVPDTEMVRVFASQGACKLMGLAGLEVVRGWQLGLFIILVSIMVHLLLSYFGF